MATILLVQCGALKKSKKKYKPVTIQFTEMYCGGAAPPEEMLQEMSVPRIYANREVEVYDNNELEGVMHLLKTNSKGELKIPLKIGKTAYLNFYDHRNKKVYETEDIEYNKCYYRFLRYRLVKIDLSNRDVQPVVFEIECNPCLPPAP
ncbi:MAG: hypothetical protein H6605_00555 [Flavobacteriales bacterium]|nr:hypothetical protein [Flavobacteriales bacterium]